MEPIKIRGLKQNNLKNISLDIPKNKIVVFTGVSGSGKSSIVFDTIAAESGRQMNETYSAWVRGRLPKYEKPNVLFIDNLNPSVVIDQSRLGGNARSTVGTISDMYSMLILFFQVIQVILLYYYLLFPIDLIYLLKTNIIPNFYLFIGIMFLNSRTYIYSLKLFFF